MFNKTQSNTVLFTTWAYKSTPEVAQPLANAYTRVANQLDGLVVPVGVAFERARLANPSMDLYAADGIHPSKLGSYLAGSVFFVAFYNESPQGSRYTA